MLLPLICSKNIPGNVHFPIDNLPLETERIISDGPSASGFTAAGSARNRILRPAAAEGGSGLRKKATPHDPEGAICAVSVQCCLIFTVSP